MSILSLAATTVDIIGLRRSRFGRSLIARLNVLGERAARHFYLSRKTPLVLDGHRMFLSAAHAPSLAFVNGVIRDGYEPDAKALMEGLIERGMNVLDVGAHVGTYTLMAARRVGPQGHVYAFEADPENYSLLKANVEMNGYRNVTCINKAVSNRNGTLTLYVSKQGNDRHTLIRGVNAESLTTRCDVQAITLDEFAAASGWPRFDLLKMDIEGAEPMALEGMTELLRRSNSLNLVMEFAPDILRISGVDPVELLTRLNSLGFRISPVERNIPEQLFAPDQFHNVVPAIGKLGAINLYCRKGGSAARS